MKIDKETKLMNFATKNSVKCSCGHTMLITNKYKRQICSWCGKMVYLRKEDEFKNRLKIAIKNTGKGIDIVPKKV